MPGPRSCRISWCRGAKKPTERPESSAIRPSTTWPPHAWRPPEQAVESARVLPGHAPWPAQAQAAISQVALARGDVERAALAGGAAMQILQEANHEDMNLEILLPASRGILAGGPPEAQQAMRGWLQLQLGRIAQGTLDEDIRV